MLFDSMYASRPPASEPAVTPARRTRRPLAAVALAAASLAYAATGTHAASASVTTRSAAAELSQQQILENHYGGTFTRSGEDFSNGRVQVQRLSNDGGADQIFQSDVVSAKAVASFARNSQTFGLLSGTGGAFNPLFSTAGGSGLDASGAADLRGDALLNTIFALQSGGTVHPRTGPQVQSYLVSEAGKSDSYLMFWEDTNTAGADFDYNDLVVELAAAAAPGGAGANNVAIPLPLAAWSALSVLGGMGALAGARRLLRGLR